MCSRTRSSHQRNKTSIEVKSTRAAANDSASVFGWIRFVLEDTKRPNVSGLSEMVVKRRLETISQLIEEYGLTMSIKLDP